MTRTQEPATELLNRASGGDIDASKELIPLIYSELRGLAERHMRMERSDHTLQPTALVHEAYLRLVDGKSIEWRGKAQFLAMAATVIRRVLVDHARGRGSAKRGGGDRGVTLVADPPDRGSESSLDLIALDEALDALATLNKRQAQVIELRFFAGLTVAETAHVLEVSERTVKGDWKIARAWLSRHLEGAS